jgi:type IV secretory pathway TrbF-like protein
MDSEFYLQARREWDERYGDLVLGKRDWQIASAGLMLLSFVLAFGIVWQSARTKGHSVRSRGRQTRLRDHAADGEPYRHGR